MPRWHPVFVCTLPLVLTSFHMSFGQTYLPCSIVATDRLPIKMLTVLNIQVITPLLLFSLFPFMQFSALQHTCPLHLRNILPSVLIFLHVSHMLQATAQHKYVLPLLPTLITFPDHPPYHILFRVTLLNNPEIWRQEALPKAKCFLIFLLQVKNKRPTWCHLLFYFTFYVLNMFRTLIYPTSGACDYSVELPHRSYCSWFDVCRSFGVVGLEWYPCCRLQPATRPMW